MNLINWIRNNKGEFFIFLIIIFTAAFFRLYKIEGYMTFLGDEGRDAIVVKDILTKFDLPLLGPPTSIGNMYLGPLYYYMMAVSMAISWLNPVSSAVMVALVGTATVGFIYYFCRIWFGKSAAIFSAILYSVSPVNIIYSRSSWNPNPAPFFALLALFGFYQAHKSRNYLWFVLTGISIAFCIQMHYLALILIPIYGILWFYELNSNTSKKLQINLFWHSSIFAVVAFLFLMSPLVIFDFRHNFMNYRAITAFFGNRETTVNLNILNTLGRIIPIFSSNLLSRYLTGGTQVLAVLLSILLPIPLILGIIKKIKNVEISWPSLALGIWLVVGLVGLSLYKQTIYDHYLGFLSPVIYLLFGALFALNLQVSKKYQQLFKGVLIILAVFLIFTNLQKSPLLLPPNNQLQRTKDVSQFIIRESSNKPFNFALIAEHNYDAAYQYYLDLYGHKPKQVPFDKTEQLFVVCEDKVCQPVGHPKYEIAAFGWTKISDEKDFEGVKVFILIHNPEEERNGG